MRIQGPVLPAELRREADMEEAVRRALREEDDVRGCLFSGGALTQTAPDDWNGTMEFRECVFENWRFSGCSMPRLGFVDAVFRGCDLSNLDLTGCSLLRCRFEDCKAVGLTLAEAKLRQVTFEQCGMRLANLSGCQCKGAGFFRCDLEGASMLGCALGKAPFDRCRLLDCNLCGTALSGIDFTTCDIGGWLQGGGELRGAVVTPVQAAELARLLGVVIKEGSL